jgi:DnaJ homologue, subfamily C, member 28, conserved domain
MRRCGGSGYDRAMPPIRRDSQGRIQTAHSWESLVERQIREAMEAGAFEDLPYQGEPLPIVDDSAAGDLAMAHRMLKSAGAAPPWIESDKEARRLLAEIEASLARAPLVSVLSRDRVRRDHAALVAAANRAIERVNAEAPTDRQHRRPLHAAAEAERLERAFAAE